MSTYGGVRPGKREESNVNGVLGKTPQGGGQ